MVQASDVYSGIVETFDYTFAISHRRVKSGHSKLSVVADPKLQGSQVGVPQVPDILVGRPMHAAVP